MKIYYKMVFLINTVRTSKEIETDVEKFEDKIKRKPIEYP